MEVNFRVDFYRNDVTDEIAKLAGISPNQISTYPYAWLYVATSMNDPKYQKRIIFQYPFELESMGQAARGYKETAPEAQPISLKASCEELQYVYDKKLLGGEFVAPN